MPMMSWGMTQSHLFFYTQHQSIKIRFPSLKLLIVKIFHNSTIHENNATHGGTLVFQIPFQRKFASSIEIQV